MILYSVVMSCINTRTLMKVLISIKWSISETIMCDARDVIWRTAELPKKKTVNL